MDGPDLFAATREHDLPPKWDGAVMQWGPWEHVWAIICPPMRPDPCERCGSTAQRLSATGTMLPTRHGPVITLHQRLLCAYRCPDCLHDTVWDRGTDEWWDLDPTDYGDDGSTPP